MDVKVRSSIIPWARICLYISTLYKKCQPSIVGSAARRFAGPPPKIEYAGPEEDEEC
jgi:hypothetical protein